MTKTTQPTKLGYRRTEICAYLGVSERTFDRMRACGGFPPPDMRVGNGRLLLWRTGTLETWVANQAGITSKTH